MCVCTLVQGLTLDDVRDHERGTGVVADETTAGQVVFDLQGKQVAAVAGEKKHRRSNSVAVSAWLIDGARERLSSPSVDGATPLALRLS